MMDNLPYEEIRNGEDGDRFDTPEEALDYMIARHRAKGVADADLPTMDNIWVAHHGDGGDIIVQKNDDGTYEGEEVSSETYCAPNPSGIRVNVSGFFGTDEKRTSPDEMYEDTWEMPRNQEELLDYHFNDSMEELEAHFAEQSGSGPKP